MTKEQMPDEVYAYADDCGTGTWIDFDDSCHKSGDVATKYIRADKVQQLEQRVRELEEQIKMREDCLDKFEAENAKLRAKVKELETEVNEQARLNGMGGEREIKLRAKLKAAEGLREALDEIKSIGDVASTKPRQAWTMQEAADIGNQMFDVATTALDAYDSVEG